ncbi:hypothetical protein MIC448_460053 [Microbacterium sp. C448]|nr:hypothetical protein MIC448_460053 [Microbacterium sp. C448]
MNNSSHLTHGRKVPAVRVAFLARSGARERTSVVTFGQRLCLLLPKALRDVALIGVAWYHNPADLRTRGLYPRGSG